MSTDLFDQFMADPYQEEIGKEERKSANVQACIEACHKSFSHTLTFDGSRKVIMIKCGYYRVCDDCRQEKYDNEVEVRLNYAQNHLNLGDRLRFDTITEDERGAYVKRLSRAECAYYAFPLPDNKLLVIHNHADGDGDELWDFGYDDTDLYNEDNGLDINFYTVLKEIPESRRITGNLGKKQEDEKKDGKGQGDEKEEKFSLKMPFLYKKGLTDHDAEIAYKMAVTMTQDIKVTNEYELERALFARVNAMAEQIKQAVVGFNFIAVTAAEIELWNANPNNFSDSMRKIELKDGNVQIITNRDNISDYLDKTNPKYYKQSNFEATLERVNKGDGLDDLRQQAIQDFLEYHGT